MARKRSKKRGNGEGTIYQRTDGTWCGQITVATDPITGKVTRKTFYGATQGEVVDKIKDYRGQHPTAAAGSQMRIKEACEFWLAGMRSQVADSSLARYNDALTHIKNYMGDSRLGEMSALGVQQALDRMELDGMSTSRRGYVLAKLRAVLRKCVRMGLVATNVAQVVDMPRAVRAKITPLTQEQVTALLKEAEGDPYEALYWLALDSGARQGELWALTWPDVDLERGEIFINKNLRRGHGGPLRIEPAKTNGSRRRITITPQTVARLKAHRDQGSGRSHTTTSLPWGDLVFTAAGGGFLRQQVWRYDYWLPLLIRAGLTRPGVRGPEAAIRFHDLRHTMATLLLLANVTPRTPCGNHLGSLAFLGRHRGGPTQGGRVARKLHTTEDSAGKTGGWCCVVLQPVARELPHLAPGVTIQFVGLHQLLPAPGLHLPVVGSVPAWPLLPCGFELSPIPLHPEPASHRGAMHAQAPGQFGIGHCGVVVQDRLGKGFLAERARDGLLAGHLGVRRGGGAVEVRLEPVSLLEVREVVDLRTVCQIGEGLGFGHEPAGEGAAVIRGVFVHMKPPAIRQPVEHLQPAHGDEEPLGILDGDVPPEDTILKHCDHHLAISQQKGTGGTELVCAGSDPAKGRQ
jgi:integrase